MPVSAIKAAWDAINEMNQLSEHILVRARNRR
ncbi:DNA-binding transcriptional regulator ModE [Escherichia coli]|uniref:DNA-binding transcriptional regulator ModE n=1 Tax=Escherichia coli TaxID=562 RepID=A0A376TJT6_ECOLX|nr:DNA-binding transcriptional regulator ModE [Escherichia coli]